MKPVDYSNINEIPHCGPVAVAAVSERPLSEVLDRARRLRGSEGKVGTMEDYELIGVLEGMGIYPESKPQMSTPRRSTTIRNTETMRRAMTLGLEEGMEMGEEEETPQTTLRDFCAENKGGPYLLVIDNSRAFGDSLHAIAVADGMIACSQTRGIPVIAKDYPHLDAAVATWWKF